MRHAVLIWAGWILCGAVWAEVKVSDAGGFVSEHVLVLKASPQNAYSALVHDVAKWWDATHSYSGRADAFSIDASPGGCFCEIADGIAVEHMRVVNVSAGHSLVMHGGLGPLQGMAVSGSMRFSFSPHASGSVLTYTYQAGGFVPGGLESMAGPVDQVQLGQLLRLQKFIETGRALN